MDPIRIVDEAMRLIDEHGAHDMTMRTLAEHLTSSTATIYRHFPTRAALLSEVVDRMFGELAVDPAEYRDIPWRVAARRFAENLFEVMSRHTHVSLLMVDQSLWWKETGSSSCPIGLNAAAVRERWLAIMQENGFPVNLAARSGAMIAHLVLGFAVQVGAESTRKETQRQERHMLAQSVYRLDLSALPATSAVAESGWRPTTIEEEFEFALELVLDRLWELRESRDRD